MLTSNELGVEQSAFLGDSFSRPPATPRSFVGALTAEERDKKHKSKQALLQLLSRDQRKWDKNHPDMGS